jgi:hypothetical protein
VSCGGFASLAEPARQVVWLALLDGDANAIRHAVEMSTGSIEVNLARKSIQIIGCDKETVLANIPLTQAQLAGLSE